MTVSSQIRETFVEKMWQNDCRDFFIADAKSNLFSRTSNSTHISKKTGVGTFRRVNRIYRNVMFV